MRHKLKDKQAEKLKRCEMKDEGWKMNDESWKMNDEGWKIKDECWKMKDEGWRGFWGQTDGQTFVIVESLSRLKIIQRNECETISI